MSDMVNGYADAMLAVAGAEGNLQQVSSELFSVARAVDGSDELRATITDARIPASTRQQVVEDLLGGRATATTVGLVSMVVGAGRAGDLSQIADAFVHRAASEQSREIASVRSAVPLTEDQQARLAAAIKQSTGKDVDVKVTLDPSVVGGLVTTIGDTVIDGSIRSRLTKLRETI